MDRKYFGNSLLSNSEGLFNSSVFVSGSYGMLASFFVFYLINLNEEYKIECNKNIFTKIK